MKKFQDIMADFNEAYSSEYERRLQVVQDIEFAFIPGQQWAGADLQQFKNRPKPENNKLFKNIMSLVGRYQEAEFGARIASASDEATEEDAELLQNRWRNDFNNSDGNEALNNATEEAFFGGLGAFRLCAKYEDEEAPKDDQQYLALEPIYSAASSVFWNVGALRKDKADAKQGWFVQRVKREDIEEEYGVDFSSFTSSDIQNLFSPTLIPIDGKDAFIAHYYEVVEKTITEYALETGEVYIRDGRKYLDQFGNTIDRADLDVFLDVVPYNETRRKVCCVEYALLSGNGFLTKPTKTPFKQVPLVPQYGYHRVINGIEYYCGEVCRQRDNQRFLNMGFGALMEIVAQSQVEKPEYTPEQMQRHAEARARAGIENHAYLLSDPIIDQAGNITHLGPIAKHTPPQIGSGLATSLQFLNQNLAEQSGAGQATLPSNTSSAAIQQVNDRTDDSFLPLMTNAAQAIRAACKTWIPAAQKLYFSNPRKIRIMQEDGTFASVTTLEMGVDPVRQEYGPYKYSARGKYDVTVRQGESYRTKREAERTAALELLQYTAPDTPMGQMALMAAIQSTTGEGMADIRRMAHMQQIQMIVQQAMPLIMAGYPLQDLGIRTKEEQAIAMVTIQIAQQQMQQQNPNAQLASAEAQARLMEGQAAMLDKQVDQFNAETKRLEAVTKAQKTGVDINKALAETQSIELENAKKTGQIITGRF